MTAFLYSNGQGVFAGMGIKHVEDAKTPGIQGDGVLLPFKSDGEHTSGPLAKQNHNDSGYFSSEGQDFLLYDDYDVKGTGGQWSADTSTQHITKGHYGEELYVDDAASMIHDQGSVYGTATDFLQYTSNNTYNLEGNLIPSSSNTFQLVGNQQNWQPPNYDDENQYQSPLAQWAASPERHESIAYRYRGLPSYKGRRSGKADRAGNKHRSQREQ